MLKLYKKTRDGYKRHIYFCGIKIYSYESKSKNSGIYDYIKKYDYVFSLPQKVSVNDNDSDIIWQYWGQSANVPNPNGGGRETL